VISLRAFRSRLTRFVSGSFAVHGVLLTVALIIPATRHRNAPIDDTMMVALAGPLMQAAAPAAGPAAPAPAPAAEKPAPAPPPKEAHTAREVPAVKPKKEPVKPKKEPEPEQAATKPQPAAKPSPPGPPGAGGGVPQGTSPAPGQGAVSASIGGGDSSLGWYGAAVKAALEAAWQKPFLEDAAGTASVVVSFDIARDGATRNIRIVQSSGIPSLDRSAQRAVMEASPLPAVPPTWTEDTVPVTMRFDLTAEAR
jgi:TonB family protein